jgi:Rrf2 family transcriptional regulator, cysteine metabolism repressor
MKLSTKGRYGLRAMIDLLANSGISRAAGSAPGSTNGSVTLAGIAERQEISVIYLEQVFSSLKKAGYVIGIKGYGGGYIPAPGADKLKAGDILEVLEGSISMIDDDIYGAGRKDNLRACIRKTVWDKINHSIKETFDSVTLGELAEEYTKAGYATAMMYDI